MGAQLAASTAVPADRRLVSHDDGAIWPPGWIAHATAVRDVLVQLKRLGTLAVVDADGRAVGTLADADVRRALLRGITLDDPVSRLMSALPADAASARRTNADPSRPDTAHMAERLVVVMAGGLGRRLRPLTDRRPKPLVDIGGRPLVELTIESLREQGFRRFVFCVGYRAHMIRRRFGDGRRLGVQIDYLKDPTRLGTAGPLGLLAQVPQTPLLVINGDVLTDVDFRQLMQFHDDAGAAATVCVTQMAVTVPYGVVSLDGDRVAAIEEKPMRRCFVNAGIYVLEPYALQALPPRRLVDMPELLQTLTRRGDRVAAFPLYESWMDVGSPADVVCATEAWGGRARIDAAGQSAKTPTGDGRPAELVFDDL